jgi:hypothetical protein
MQLAPKATGVRAHPSTPLGPTDSRGDGSPRLHRNPHNPRHVPGGRGDANDKPVWRADRAYGLPDNAASRSDAPAQRERRQSVPGVINSYVHPHRTNPAVCRQTGEAVVEHDPTSVRVSRHRSR